ncbi:hypothetical protein GCM10009114_24110 [Aliiglaciecola litoralis]|uniref:Uncharacterized protein n=1 Tax=Aliiglaciecola litoralis TaxID=582857 RepID=A0ABN1LLJ6_9ALTE
MDMDVALNRLTKLIITCLVVSTLLHVILYMSDSENYRRWVTVQIGLQLFSVILLFFTLKRKLIALITFFVVSMVFTFVNAVYTNYAHEFENVAFFIIFWCVYGYILFKGWSQSSPNKPLKRDK